MTKTQIKENWLRSDLGIKVGEQDIEVSTPIIVQNTFPIEQPLNLYLGKHMIYDDLFCLFKKRRISVSSLR